MTYFAIYCAGGWITSTVLHYLERNDNTSIAWASAMWPFFWLVTFGLLIRTAVLRARERAIAEGKKRFGA